MRAPTGWGGWRWGRITWGWAGGRGGGVGRRCAGRGARGGGAGGPARRGRGGGDRGAGGGGGGGGPGGEPLGGLADLSRTVGWFTSVHPVRLELGTAHPGQVGAGGPAAGRVLKAVKEQVRAAPGDGLGYGLLRYLNPGTGPVLAGRPAPPIRFNHPRRFTAPTPPAR